MKVRTLPGDLVRPVSLLLEDLGTPIALSTAIKLRYGLWDEISSVSLDPRLYLDPESYFKDAAAVSILKKMEALPTSKEERRARAIEKWWEGERSCYATNERLNRYLPCYTHNTDVDSRISAFLAEVRQVVASWIGVRPPELLEGRFGKGATYSDRGGNSTVPDKMSSDPSLTRDAVWFLPQWFGTQWGAALAQRHGNLSFVRGNRFATVPKTSRIDRAIASEPAINIFYQLAVGREIRARLKKATGWDMDVAQDVHRRVARESSVTREFATLDLSNASDTVAKSLVKLLLPHAWFSLMNDLRSPTTELGDKCVVLEKFSSMGNGFTFELETIIFAALSCCASRANPLNGGVLGKDVFVFGDDIIVRNDDVKSVIAVLKFCGFQLNSEKSFFGDEPFRESCGGDYFMGQPVRPYFLKDSCDEPQDWIVMANGIQALLGRFAFNGQNIPRRAWFAVLDNLPIGIRGCRGPSGLGDICIHDEEKYWAKRHRRSIRYIRCYRPARKRVKRYEWYDASVVLACATYGGTDNTGSPSLGRPGLGGVVPRDAVLSYKVGWVPYS
jgi:hypothetical protein